MGTKAIDPQSIRNTTLIGEPAETTGVVDRVLRCYGSNRSGGQTTVHWPADGTDHTIRLTELSSRAPIATLERCIRVADSVIAIVNAAATRTPRLETTLRVADDHQVARLCLIIGLDQPGTDFERCVRTIADTRGATPVVLHDPVDLPHQRIRSLTRIGDIVPVLCSPPPTSDDIAPLLDAIARYLPSPLDVCQPEHALDY
ncbi:GTP-binding protein [Nocardia concava]|uniref:GTP-binding protein n=1 Tax=Nocardia concava TaxID=257281 RepID=UPI0003050C8C|nr:GTP-binding protein [Nocardia concava]